MTAALGWVNKAAAGPLTCDQAIVGEWKGRPSSVATPIFSPASVAPLTAAHWEGRLVYTRAAALLLQSIRLFVTPPVDGRDI